MNNIEIASRIRRILYNANERTTDDGRIDFASCHCYMMEALTELLLDVIKAPKI